LFPGPLLAVEMLGVGRSRRYFVLRAVYALAALLLLWMAYEAAVGQGWQAGQANVSLQRMARAASAFFVSYSWLQLLAILLLTPGLVAGSIATERERRTIEYLFATDLSNAEIVFGKTLARLLLVAQLLVTGLPILMLFRLLGGLPANLVLASLALAASSAFLLTSLSMCLSVWSPTARDATVRVYAVAAVLLLLPLGLFPVFQSLAGGSGGTAIAREIWLQSLELNPLYLLGQAVSLPAASGAGFDAARIYRMAGWHAALAVGGLALATAAVRRVHLREASRGDRGPWLFRRSLPLPRWRLPLGDHPVVWKELFAAGTKTRLGAAGRIAIGLLIAWTLAMTVGSFWSAAGGTEFQRRNAAQFSAFMMGVVACGALLVLAARGAALITYEKERDTWTSLLATPLSGAEIVLGKAAGNLYAGRWSLLLMLLVAAAGVVLHPAAAGPLAGVVLVVLVLAGFVTLFGLYCSLISRTTLKATGLSLAATILLGGGYLLFCCPVLATGGGGDAFYLLMSPCMPFLMAYPMSIGETPQSGFVDWAFGLGISGYLAAAAVLAVRMTRGFDALAGRTRPQGHEG